MEKGENVNKSINSTRLKYNGNVIKVLFYGINILCQ